MTKSIAEYSAILNGVRENIKSAVIVREELIDNILICLCNESHILLEDMPGTGKTTMAKALAASVDASFRRIQCVPDILPSDITGINYYSQKENDFVFRPGPVFTNILLADEINRASPRSQSALLECMEEKQVSVDNATHKLSNPFIVIATQNPIETAGTFPLPEAQLDRFMMMLQIGYPTKDMEKDIIRINIKGVPVQELKPVCSSDDVMQIKQIVSEVTVSEPIYDYIIEIIQATRRSEHIKVGASPRSAVALTRAAQAKALLSGRGYVLPDDVKSVALPILSHRIVKAFSRSLNMENNISSVQILTSIIDGIKAPVKEFGEMTD